MVHRSWLVGWVGNRLMELPWLWVGVRRELLWSLSGIDILSCTEKKLQRLFCYASPLAPAEITQKGYCGDVAYLLFSQTKTIDEPLVQETGRSRVQTILNAYTRILNIVLPYYVRHKYNSDYQKKVMLVVTYI